MRSKQPRFYGWPLVGIGWLLYGFGVAPAFYSWGFFLPEMLDELDMSRFQGGLIFSFYMFFGAAAGPLVGMAVTRWGPRRAIAAGSFAGAVGFFLTSRADSFLYFVLAFSLLAGFGHAFATIIPHQALAANWFLKYRARATAIIFTAGGIVGFFVPRFNAWLLEHSYSWRTAWVVVAAITLVIAFISTALVRNRPEDVGQLRDGAATEDELRATAEGLGSGYDKHWTAAQAVRTPQFYLLAFCGLGYAVPWAVLAGHGRLHLQDLGFDISIAGAILGTMALVSTVGRLSGLIGDFIPPLKVLSMALLVEAIGSALLLVARTEAVAYVAVIALGIGFGMAYISIAVVFSSFFGRQAFATTTGIRFLIGGTFNALSPALAGYVFDRTASYDLAFGALAILGLGGALVAFFVRPPKEPEEASSLTTGPEQ